MESFNSQVAYQALCDNTTNILEAELDPHSFASKLLTLRIIGNDDMKRITDEYSGKTARERMKSLLDIVVATVKGNGTVFDQFIKILEKCDSSQREKDLAKKIMASYKGNDK